MSWKITISLHVNFRNPAAIDDGTKMHASCLGKYGGPIEPNVALGGYPLGEFSKYMLEKKKHISKRYIVLIVGHFKRMTHKLEIENISDSDPCAVYSSVMTGEK